jgi:hypothetical protein
MMLSCRYGVPYYDVVVVATSDFYLWSEQSEELEALRCVEARVGVVIIGSVWPFILYGPNGVRNMCFGVLHSENRRLSSREKCRFNLRLRL